MEAWIRETLIACSSTVSTAALPAHHEQDSKTAVLPASETAPGAPSMIGSLEAVPADWENEVEMQRLLDLLPVISSDGDINDRMG